MVGIAGNVQNDTELLGPFGDDVIATLVPPSVTPPGTLNVAVVDVEFKTFTSATVIPLPTTTVIGAPNRLPVSVTGTAAPATPKAGVTVVSAGTTLIESVYAPVTSPLFAVATI